LPKLSITTTDEMGDCIKQLATERGVTANEAAETLLRAGWSRIVATSKYNANNPRKAKPKKAKADKPKKAKAAKAKAEKAPRKPRKTSKRAKTAEPAPAAA